MLTVDEKRAPEVIPFDQSRRVQSARDGKTLFQNVALIFCLLFGLAMIAFTQTAADGVWFWYATLFRNGHRLYGDLHLALQPLYVLETAPLLTILGNGWLVGKLPAIVHLVVYCVGLLLVARSSRLSDRQKALVFACAFFIGTNFMAYRFDDFHVIADTFQVYSLVLLLLLERTSGPSRRLYLVVALGIVCGLSLMTRLNDGAALFVAVAIAILCLVPSRRIRALALFSATAGLTVVSVVHLTGDSLHDWAANSIFKAAGIKGGAGHVLADPLQLPWNSAKIAVHSPLPLLLIYCLGGILIWVTLIRSLWRPERKVNVLGLLAGMIFILLPFPYLGFHAIDSGPIFVFPPVGVLLAYALCATVMVRFLCRKLGVETSQAWDPREILFLIPLSQLASGSMSSGGSPFGLTAPLAMIILLLPIAPPIRLKREPARAFAFAVLTLLTFDCVVHKFLFPFFWHSYQSAPMFYDRQWYHHPDYGPMVIERSQLAFVEPICEAVKADGAQQGLLSLPFPYPNYFCNIPPWHGYVQTFFDTSSKQTIDSLMDELQRSPPKWIVYQRQLANLDLHERVYSQGAPLPHRYLDKLIEQKIASGDWQVVSVSSFENRPKEHPIWDNHWLLIRTR